MPAPIEVDPDEVRALATRLAGTGSRVALTVAEAPDLVVHAPGWAASAAAQDLERAAAGLFGALGADITATAAQLRHAAGWYEAADARAAARLADAAPAGLR